jgi:hypothetical protein
MTPDLKRRANQLTKLPGKAYKVFKDVTPKQSGNAKRNTTLSGNTIKANYSYATPLDQGKSKQAPLGMTKPTINFVKKQSDKILKRK